MAAAADDGLTVATDVAEALVRDGVPFREAHGRVAGRIARGERFSSPSAAEAIAARRGPGMPGRWRDQLDELRPRVAARTGPVA
jgi:argininosuccinate lyase